MGPQPTQAPPCCTKCNRPPINGQCTSNYIAVMVRCSEVLVAYKGLIHMNKLFLLSLCHVVEILCDVMGVCELDCRFAVDALF